MPRIALVTTADDLAADLLVLQIRRRNVDFFRFNQEDFPEYVDLVWRDDATRGTIAMAGEVIHCSDVRSAWFRHTAGPSDPAPEDRSHHGFVMSERAGYLCGFLETMPWYWMNRPSAVAFAGNKLQQLVRARELGLSVPETLATNSAHAAGEFVRGRKSIAKTVTNAGISLAGQQYVVYTTPVTADDLTDSSVGAAPVIFQQRVANEFDLRVTVVGTQVFAARILVQERDRKVDWRAVDSSRVAYECYCLPAEIEKRCIALARAFSLTYAALDFIVTPDGEHVFLEINPSGQWVWLEHATGLPISNAIVDQLIEGAS